MITYKKLQALFLKRFNIPREREVRKTVHSFTLAERAVFYFFVLIFIFSGALLLFKVNSEFLVEVPIRGGTLAEGVIGNPRFINPVLAISEADKNLTSLVYSGLVRITSGGQAVNDLADSVEISKDGLVYSAHLRENVVFHDGKPITAEDVIFTIQKITNPATKSPQRGNWDSINVEKVDDFSLNFTLKKAYGPFINNLSIGILPKHIWKNVSDDEFAFSQFNTLPVGSGPYKVVGVERNNGGIPNYYRLSPFEDVAGKVPYIENLEFKFYSNEKELLDAYGSGDIKSFSGVSPDKVTDLRNDTRIASSPLSRIFAVFFNQGQSKVLALKEVRQALNFTAPREEIIRDVLYGYGTPIDSPLPAGLFSWSAVQEKTNSEDNLAEAKEILSKAGWKLNEQSHVLEKKSGSSKITLSFSISTGDAPELRAVANKLIEAWGKLGAQVDILVFETGDLNQNVIRPRRFDALLFGEVVGREADVYPFWHSSQRNDPGLNISLYANSRADKYLEMARSASDLNAAEKNYKAFKEEITSDLPAVFLYTPNFLYILPNSVEALSLGLLSTPQDRFAEIRDWYIETDRVWKIFANN